MTKTAQQGEYEYLAIVASKGEIGFAHADDIEKAVKKAKKQISIVDGYKTLYLAKYPSEYVWTIDHDSFTVTYVNKDGEATLYNVQSIK